ncbi:MAG TPA: hypothetical protein PLZ16_05430 [Gammaproteobacteria bacterium]|nr:hypothetical protein [Gammaproteobacteria bacterium]
MKTQYMKNLKTDQFDEIDLEYYIAKGRHLRAQAVAEMLQSLFSKLRQVREKTHQMPLKPKAS